MATYAHSQDEALQAAAMSFGRVVTIRDTETGSDGDGNVFAQVNGYHPAVTKRTESPLR